MSVRQSLADVRITPESGRIADGGGRLKCAKSGCEQLQQGSSYSITSSAMANSEGGTVRPGVVAVLRLMISSNLVGACTGRSDAFAPRRMRSI
jgi:hypothetical protein